MRLSILLLLMLLAEVPTGMPTWDRMHQRENLWVTLANLTGQQHMCLSLRLAGDPFRTCFMGLPLDPMVLVERLKGYIGPLDQTCKSVHEYCQCLCDVDGTYIWPSIQNDCLLRSVLLALNKESVREPQEIDLLWSVPPGVKTDVSGLVDCKYMTPKLQLYNATGVVLFGGYEYYHKVSRASPEWESHTNVSGTSRFWNISVATEGLALTIPGAKQLPPGIFLICENRAYSAIPWRPIGGLCYLGQLALISTPYLNFTARHRRIRSIPLAQDCDDNVDFLAVSEAVATSFFTPGVMAAINYNVMKKLACWARTQVNATSLALAEIIEDVQSIGKATLQNRAAIDFLLLLHNHGCDEFEGLCCFNVSDHSASVYRTIKQLQDNLQKITIHKDYLADWLSSLGLPAWLLAILKPLVVVVIIIVVILLFGPCIFLCCQRCLENTVTTMFKKQKGGDVVSCLVRAKAYGLACQ